MATSLIPFGTRTNLFDDFRREMDNLLSRFGRSEGNGGELATWFSPSANIAETDKAFEVTVDIPGMKAEDVDVEVKQGNLWITGERKEEKEEKGKTWHRIERQYGKFRRIIELDQEVDATKVDAEYKNGVLKVTVPKSEKTQAKRIAVKG